jgi:Zinc knuckle
MSKPDDCDVEEEEKENDDDEQEIDPEVDLCLAGTNTGACFNCGEIGHFSWDCKKPKKPFNKKKPFFNKKKVDGLATSIWNLDAEERDTVLDSFEKEGF